MARTKSKTVWLSRDASERGRYQNTLFVWPRSPLKNQQGTYRANGRNGSCIASAAITDSPFALFGESMIIAELRPGDCIKVKIQSSIVERIETKDEVLERLATGKQSTSHKLGVARKWIEANG